MARQVSEQVTLPRGDVYRVPTTAKQIHIISGRAWLTFLGKDIVLERGENISLDPGKDRAVISSLGTPVVVLKVSRG
ncbi:MAG TPA: hypothetical protein VMT34_04290 [Aggregatilineales bacterium]|nr:hypothetical protein [Aggregatilineales bacterium]